MVSNFKINYLSILLFILFQCRVTADLNNPLDGINGLLANFTLILLKSAIPSITVEVNGQTYKNGDTISITGNKSNTDYSISLKVINNSSVNLNLTGGSKKAVISGTNSGNFTASDPTLATLIPGASSTFNVSFNTNTLGDKLATLSLPNDDRTNSDFKLNLKGIFDPKETFVLGGLNLIRGRDGHTINLLESGKLLVTGGQAENPQEITNSTEIISTDTNSISIYKSLNRKRTLHSVIKLNNGKFLIVGGITDFNGVGATTAELFDPITETFSDTGDLNSLRIYNSVTLLKDGRVLLAGGATCLCINSPKSNAEIYNPTTGVFTQTGSMNITRQNHSAVLLSDGRVLILGGNNGQNTPLASTEIYNPTSGTFSLGVSMQVGRIGPLVSPIINGKALIAGGDGGGISTEYYIESSNSFAIGPNLIQGKSTYSEINQIHLLSDGRLALMGMGSSTNLEVFSFVTNKIETSSNFIITARARNLLNPYSATLTKDGKIFITGGAFSKQSEIFYP
jgi:hypothetical protein